MCWHFPNQATNDMLLMIHPDASLLAVIAALIDSCSLSNFSELFFVLILHVIYCLLNIYIFFH